MGFDILRTTLSAAVADGGTIQFTTPRDAGAYRGGHKHKLFARGLMAVFEEGDADGISVSISGTTATVTYGGSTSIPANTEVVLELNYPGEEDLPIRVLNTTNRAKALVSLLCDFGEIDTADADGVCASQSISTTGTINGALASGGVATFDVPRNVVAAWTTTAVLTVTGTDEYGNVLVESSASGTSFTGKKAFKTVTGVAASTAITSATVGSGVVIGLPVFIPYAAGSVLKEIQDGANATAGTIVAGVAGTPTATTGDVRGTWAPNGTPNGAIDFAIVVQVPDPNDLGGPQYEG